MTVYRMFVVGAVFFGVLSAYMLLWAFDPGLTSHVNQVIVGFVLSPLGMLIFRLLAAGGFVLVTFLFVLAARFSYRDSRYREERERQLEMIRKGEV